MTPIQISGLPVTDSAYTDGTSKVIVRLLRDRVSEQELHFTVQAWVSDDRGVPVSMSGRQIATGIRHVSVRKAGIDSVQSMTDALEAIRVEAAERALVEDIALQAWDSVPDTGEPDETS